MVPAPRRGARAGRGGAPGAAAAPPAAAPPSVPGLGVRAASLVALALATLAAFAGVRHNGWIVLDDGEYVFGNPHVTSGLTWANVTWFLHATHGSNWHPLTSWSHLVAVQFFGLAPGAHHLVDLALHVANALLLVVVLHRLTGAWWRGLAVGALWALHPLRVESVAWASERKDVLSTLFFLLALDAWRRWVERPGAARYAAVVLLAALGLMAKPMLVTLPLVLVILDAWPLGRLAGGAAAATGPNRARRSLAALVLEKWPLLLLAAAAALATLLVQRHSGAVLAAGPPLPARIANALLACVRYVGATLLPRRLVPAYPLVPVPAWQAFAAFAALAAAALLAWRSRQRWPALAAGGGWYVVTLLPVLGLVQVGVQSHADRYTYIPGIGLLLALAWAPWPARKGRALVAAALALAALLGALTARQVALWHDSITLFSRAARVAPASVVAHASLGAALRLAGRDADARRELETALRLEPRYPEACENLGRLLLDQGQPAAALPLLEVVTTDRPDDAGAASAQASALATLGRAEAAIAAYRRALALAPDQPEALDGLAILLIDHGSAAEAVPLLARASALAPREADLAYHLAVATRMAGGAAVQVATALRRALALRPGWAGATSELAWLLATTPDASVRDPAAAARLAREAVAATGGRDANALDARAAALAAGGDFAGATRDADAAAALADAAGDARLAAQVRVRRALYARGAAYVEPGAAAR